MLNSPATYFPEPASGLDLEADSSGSDHSHIANRWSPKTIWARIVGAFSANAGLLFIIGSQFQLTVVNVAVKKLIMIDPPVPTLELIWVRMTITYLCTVGCMYFMNVPEKWLGPREVRGMLIFRGVSGFFGMFGIYHALQYLSVSDATVLTFIAPFTTAIAASLFLKESFTLKQALAGAVSFVGVVLIARPTFLFGSSPTSGDPAVLDPDSAERGTSQDRLIAVGVSLLGVLGATGAYISLRAIGTRAHPLHSLASFSLQSVGVSSIALWIKKIGIVIPTSFAWLGLLGVIGIFGFIGQVLLVMGFQRETAVRGSLALYSQIVFTLALQSVFFTWDASVLSILGTVIIIGSGVYVGMTGKEEESSGPDYIPLHQSVPSEDLEKPTS